MQSVAETEFVSVTGRVAIFIAAHVGFFACLSVFLGA